MTSSVRGEKLLQNLERVHWVEVDSNRITLQCVCCLAPKDVNKLEPGQSSMFCDIHDQEWINLVLRIDETEEGKKQWKALMERIESVSLKAL